MDFKAQLKELGVKTLANMASVKFYILITVTIFFYMGKLSEGTWQETVLIVAGLRAVNEVSAMWKNDKAKDTKTKASKG